MTTLDQRIAAGLNFSYALAKATKPLISHASVSKTTATVSQRSTVENDSGRKPIHRAQADPLPAAIHHSVGRYGKFTAS